MLQTLGNVLKINMLIREVQQVIKQSCMLVCNV